MPKCYAFIRPADPQCFVSVTVDDARCIELMHGVGRDVKVDARVIVVVMVTEQHRVGVADLVAVLRA